MNLAACISRTTQCSIHEPGIELGDTILNTSSATESQNNNIGRRVVHRDEASNVVYSQAAAKARLEYESVAGEGLVLTHQMKRLKWRELPRRQDSFQPDI